MALPQEMARLLHDLADPQNPTSNPRLQEELSMLDNVMRNPMQPGLGDKLKDLRLGANPKICRCCGQTLP